MMIFKMLFLKELETREFFLIAFCTKWVLKNKIISKSKVSAKSFFNNKNIRFKLVTN
jgi:hypothetical protein